MITFIFIGVLKIRPDRLWYIYVRVCLMHCSIYIYKSLDTIFFQGCYSLMDHKIEDEN